MRRSSDFCKASLYTSCLMGEEIHAQLTAFLSRRPIGRVHSIFENGINLAMEDELIFVGTTKNGRVPFGIHMGQESVRRLRFYVRCNDEVVARTPDMLQFCHPQYPVTLDLSRATSFHYEIRAYHYSSFLDLFHVDTLMATCLTWGVPTGLDVEWNRFLANDYRPDDRQYATIQHAEQLLDALLSGEVRAIAAPLRYFLGRGPGLTPSGDDFLIGLLAVHRLTGAFHPAFLTILRHILETEAITTDVSKAYLLHALDGRFSDKVTRVLNAMVMRNVSYFQTRLLLLLQTGHSSGIDTVFGIANAIMALRRYKHVRTSCDCIGGQRHFAATPRSNL
ncbi:hypothetical protein B4V02_20105 [Paenibacillus kribbensis]|uniref:DUF2877 domain-containing protein n=1 Tax=Paenibacillus kribbensis TaxID=172713 RepID=A0A222WS43_9BACL|nr:DUF2877 domain-containing protein [Paenibacillus kribbensis]ASR48835.1 hypothetical protein B4V02_20105 [Paenibacillus kribbensis]